MIIELTDEEMGLLTLTLGIAAGRAMKEENRELARSLLRLANAVHRNNPRWTPYSPDHPRTTGER